MQGNKAVLGIQGPLSGMTNQILEQQIYRQQPTFRLHRFEDPSLITSLTKNVRDLLFPEKQSPLRLTSRPATVRSIWEQRNMRRPAVLSLVVHSLLIAGVLIAAAYQPQVKIAEQPKERYVLVTPSDLLPLVHAPAEEAMQGGGGGGEIAKIEAPKGMLPKQSMIQMTPPQLKIKNPEPKLAVEPTVVVPENVPLDNAPMPTLGDPITAKVAGPESNGVGAGGGIGAGRGTGIGIGTGAGVGQGSGGGYGGGVFKVGGGIQAPQAIYKTDPEFTEEARVAKHQGTVLLWLIVGADGKPRDIKVVRPLGMGLDQKAVESVRQWKFSPALKGGKPVAVEVRVEVAFTLH
jgi:periplasmic protein TonB